jgi:hypothetical protein
VCVSVCVGSNWASRQGFTDLTREFLKSRHVFPGVEGKASTKDVRLSTAEEALAGIIGTSLRLSVMLACMHLLSFYSHLL